MTELAVVLLLMALLFGMTVPIVNTVFSATEYVNNTYANEDQLLPVSTHLQSLIRAIVSPAPPTAVGQYIQPIPAFAVYQVNNTANNLICSQTGGICPVYQATPVLTGLTSTSITFFTNIGDPNGPAEVVAQLTGPATDQVFTVTVAHAKASTCPFSLSAGTFCSWNSPTTLIRVANVVNQVNPLQPNFEPVFTYTLAGGGGVPVAPGALAATFSSCTSTTCNADQIEDVGVDLKVNVSNNPNQGQADDQTVIYQLSASSQAYSQSVG